MKIVVIGSSGYIGKHLCIAHRLHGDEVIELSSSGHGINPDSGLFPSKFSILTDTDVVYFLAQSPRYRCTPEAASHLLSVNCVAAVQAAEAARLAGVKRFIYASTGNVYCPSFDPLNEASQGCRTAWYPLSKLMAEDALSLYRQYMKVTIVRIFGVYGARQKNKLVPFLIQALKLGKPIFVDRHPNDVNDIGGLRVSFIYIDDLVKVFTSFAEMTSPPELINVGGKQALSVREIISILGHQLGIEPVITVSEKYRSGDLVADVTLLRSLTDINFTNIENGLASVLAEEKG